MSSTEVGFFSIRRFSWSLTLGLTATAGIGGWVWAAVLAIAGFIYSKRSEWLPIFLPSILVWATLMAAAPTVWPFRYSQYWIVVVPRRLCVFIGYSQN